jgi:proline dehydrogenase
VRAVHDTTPEGFAAIKVTALGEPALLERVSNTLLALNGFFATLDTAGRGSLTRDEFVSGWSDAFDGVSEQEASELYDTFARANGAHQAGSGGVNGAGGGASGAGDTEAATFSYDRLDVLAFTAALPLERLAPLVATCREVGPLYRAALTDDELLAYSQMMGRLQVIPTSPHLT